MAHHHWGEMWHGKFPYLSLVASHSWLIWKFVFPTRGFATRWGKIHTTLLLSGGMRHNFHSAWFMVIFFFKILDLVTMMWKFFARKYQNFTWLAKSFVLITVPRACLMTLKNLANVAFKSSGAIVIQQLHFFGFKDK